MIKTKTILLILSAIVFNILISTHLHSQNNQDCVGAIAVCQSTYYQENSYSGVGTVNDIPSGLSCPTTCMSAGERNSVWYTFQVQTAGWLDFRIQPIGADDYDWALFSLATHSCSDLTNTSLLPSMEVSCNWSSETGSATGANNLSNNTGVDCADASAVPNNPRLWVNVGEIYYLNVSNYSSSSSGYNLNFQNSTATIFDNTPPSFTGINTNVACGATTITVYFSENVLCSSVNPSDFNIVSAGGTTHTVTAVSGQACSQGGASENEYVLTVTPAITSGGTYTISLVGPISDACGNVASTATFDFFINQVYCSITNTINPDCGVNNGAITVTAGSGSGSYTYTWNTTPVQNGTSATGLGPGTYTVTVQDGACHSECVVTLTSGNAPTIATSTTSATCGLSNGTATATPTGTPPYTYTWSTTPAQTDPTATGLAPGTYTVTVNDANNCPGTASVTISNSAGPTINSVSSTNSTCTDNNGSLTANVSGGTTPYGYSWSTTPAQTGATASNLPAGTYTVTVSDANSCTTTSSATIVFQAGPTITSQTITHSTCGLSNGSISIVTSSGTAPLTSTWSTTPAQTGTSISNLPAGSYTVTVSDANSCTTTASYTINDSPGPQITNQIVVNPTCGNSNGSIDITITGGAAPTNIAWNTTPVQTGTSLINLPPGTYNVTVTDANSCTSTASIVVSSSAAPSITSITATNSSCTDNNGSLTANVSGGTTPYGYSWSTTPAQTGATASNLPAGTYTVTVTDANNCTTTSSATITFQPGPTITDQDITASTCGLANGVITIYTNSGTAPLTSTWSTTPAQTGNTISNLLPGSYTVTVSDANSCTTTASYTISDNPSPQISSPTITDAMCGASNGSIVITVTGGTAPVTITWNTTPAQTGTSLSNLAPGSYTVTVSDANSCTQTQTYSIINIAGPTISNSSIQNSTCGQSNGAINIVVNTTGNITYSWNTSPPQTSQNLANIPAGSYTVTATDENNCTTTATYTVNNIAGPTISNTSRQHATCGQSNGRATITVTGGTAPISYAWNSTPPQSTPIATGLAPGTYIVTVTDATGCTLTSSFTIQNLAGPQITQIVKVDETCNGMNGSATVQYTGGNGAVSIVWNTVPAQTTATINNLGSGTYSVTIRDTNNCTATSSVDIVNFPAPTIDGFTATDELCDGQNGTIQVNYTGGSAPISFLWNTVPPQTTQTASNLVGGVYSVTITDIHNCTVTGTWSIVNHPKPTSQFTNIVMDTCIVGSGKVSAFVQGGSGVYSYLWNTQPAQNTEYATDLWPGVYTIVINDGYCSITDSIEIIGIPGPIADFTVSPPLAPLSNAKIRFTDITPPQIVQWAWGFGDGFRSSDQNPIHIYQNTGEYDVYLVVTDNHGCVDTAWGTVIIDVDFGIWIPNAFTPNDDGKNDRFGPRAIGFIERDYNMKIFDRWGQMVFETSDYYTQWDGTIRGSDVENNVIATYVYEIIIYDNLNKRHKFFGKLSLIY